MSFLDPRMAQRLAIYTNKFVPFHRITAFVAEVRQFSLPIAMMQITNNNQWLWRVTQAICFFVQRSVFSWALPAGVRIPSNAIFFCLFLTSIVSLLLIYTHSFLVEEHIGERYSFYRQGSEVRCLQPLETQMMVTGGPQPCDRRRRPSRLLKCTSGM